VTDFVHYELLTMSYDPADAPALPVAASSYYYNSDRATPEATLLAQGAAAAQELRLTSADRLCVPVTLNHSMGFGFGCLAAWHAGAALVLPSPTPDAAATLAAVRDERCSILLADSHTLKALSDVQREQVPSLRGGLSKVGSGEAFGLGEPRVFAGVALVTVGKPPSP
jgi:acyl-CoA synthetase (AMP-forming)/AMP-acid ligase II